MRRVYVYRLDVIYPPGSHARGWAPAGWDPSDKWDDEDGNPLPFAWPRERMYLSRGGADERARLLRGYGAIVTVRRSARVTFPPLTEQLSLEHA